jgi:glycogen debranching enzyme
VLCRAGKAVPGKPEKTAIRRCQRGHTRIVSIAEREDRDAGSRPWEAVRDALRAPLVAVPAVTGDICPSAGPYGGVWYQDARVLSRWELTANGHPLELEEMDQVARQAWRFRLRVPDTSLLVFRQHVLDLTLHEELLVMNIGDERCRQTLEVIADADFADILEPERQGDGRFTRRIGNDSLVLSYCCEDFLRGARIGVQGRDVRMTKDGFAIDVDLAPHDAHRVAFTIEPFDESRQEHQPLGYPQRIVRQSEEDARWLAQWPAVESEPESLALLYRRGIQDLAALRLVLDGEPSVELYGAGRPAYLTLFGRDAIILALAALPFRRGPAESALRILARLQGCSEDRWTGEQPGRIPHELRLGESGRFGRRPPISFGSVDATPLFVVLLDEYASQTGDLTLARELEGHARAALEWMWRYGDADGDLLIEYGQGDDATRIRNQSWKDSDDAIVFPNGALADPPIAASEVQAYAYAALRRGARLARRAWGDDVLARDLARRAAALRQRFDEAFWLPDEQTYAMALDPQKRPIPTLSSSIGHLLAAGIVPHARSGLLVSQMLRRPLNSGWGVRTVASGSAAFDPLGYHRGTIWPHDVAVGVLGAARYGFHAEAAEMAASLVETSAAFGFRLPEVFAGYDDAVMPLPAEYPDAARPLGMASAAVLTLLQALTLAAGRTVGVRVATDLPPLRWFGIR